MAVGVCMQQGTHSRPFGGASPELLCIRGRWPPRRKLPLARGCCASLSRGCRWLPNQPTRARARWLSISSCRQPSSERGRRRVAGSAKRRSSSAARSSVRTFFTPRIFIERFLRSLVCLRDFCTRFARPACWEETGGGASGRAADGQGWLHFPSPAGAAAASASQSPRPCGCTYPNLHVLGQQLLGRLQVVIDEPKAGGLAAAESGAEAIDEHHVRLRPIHLRHLFC